MLVVVVVLMWVVVLLFRRSRRVHTLTTVLTVVQTSVFQPLIMCLHMFTQGTRVSVGFIAAVGFATVRFCWTVYMRMFFAVRTVGKASIAAFLFAFEWFFACNRKTRKQIKRILEKLIRDKLFFYRLHASKSVATVTHTNKHTHTHSTFQTWNKNAFFLSTW